MTAPSIRFKDLQAKLAAIKSAQANKPKPRLLSTLSQESTQSTNKSDFSLYVVGEFDLATGCVVNRDPRVLIHGRDILTDSLPDAPYGGTTAK